MTTQDYINRYRPLASRGLASFRRASQPVITRSIIEPGDLSSCVSWVRSEDLASSLSDGESLTTWDDISGNGNDWAQFSNHALPTFETNELNGFPSVRFAANTSALVSTVSFSSGGFSVVCLARRNGAGGDRAIQGSNNWLLGAYGNMWRAHNGAGFTVTQGPQGTTVGAFPAGISQTIGSSTVCWCGSSRSSRADGSAPGTIGMGSGGAFNESLAGDMFEVALFNEALSEDTLISVLDYLRKKYGLR